MSAGDTAAGVAEDTAESVTVDCSVAAELEE